MSRLTRPRRTGLPAPLPLAELRRQIDGATGRYPRHPAVTADYRHYGGIRCLVLTPPTMVSDLLYFHGGGFRIGSPELAAGFVSHLAARSHCRIILPFYSLAPEHPFPGALLDGRAVLEALPPQQPLLLGGDSAGGNLATVLARHFHERVRGVLLLSPWLDLRVTAPSYDSNSEHDRVFGRTAARQAADLYLQGLSPEDIDVSPLLASPDNMPPCWLAVGSHEVLLDDARRFAVQLSNAGRPVSLQVIDNMAHTEPVTTAASPHVEDVLVRMTDFIGRCLETGRGS